MQKLTKVAAAAILVVAITLPVSALAFWGGGPWGGAGPWGGYPGYYGGDRTWTDAFGDMFGDFDISARGRGWGRGAGDYYDYYQPYGGGPYGYPGYGHPYGGGYAPYAPYGAPMAPAPYPVPQQQAPVAE